MKQEKQSLIGLHKELTLLLRFPFYHSQNPKLDTHIVLKMKLLYIQNNNCLLKFAAILLAGLLNNILKIMLQQMGTMIWKEQKKLSP